MEVLNARVRLRDRLPSRRGSGPANRKSKVAPSPLRLVKAVREATDLQVWGAQQTVYGGERSAGVVGASVTGRSAEVETSVSAHAAPKLVAEQLQRDASHGIQHSTLGTF